MYKQSPHILRQIKKGLGFLLILAVAGEMLFFPTLANGYGCLMAVISYCVFSYFLKEKYIRLFPFAFCMYLSMFMYRYLPLIATLAEGKPITYGFERPFETFIYEIFLFLLSSLAFYLSCHKPPRQQKNNIIQNSLFQLKFFEITPTIIWGIGLLGLLIRLYNLGAGDVEYGDVEGKFLLGLDYLMYAPLILFFPSLLNLKYDNRKIIWVYGILIFVINIASNSRQSIIAPIGILAILFVVYLVLNNIKITTYISPLRMLFLGLSLIFLANFLSNVSLAMLYTRKIRSEVDKLELFQLTLDTLKDEALMSRLKAADDEGSDDLISYEQGWTEHYVENFMLARYANMRISDQTLYYAEKKGFANRQMLLLFTESVMALLPTPILRLFGIYLDKNKMEFSRGDYLYGSGFGGYRVTSHIGDGLATFSYWYFPIQLLAFFLVFKLLNCFVFYSLEGVRYAPYALMNVFAFLGMFRNAIGVSADVAFIIRGFLQGIVTYLIVFHVIRAILYLVNPK